MEKHYSMIIWITSWNAWFCSSLLVLCIIQLFIIQLFNVSTYVRMHVYMYLCLIVKDSIITLDVHLLLYHSIYWQAFILSLFSIIHRSVLVFFQTAVSDLWSIKSKAFNRSSMLRHSTKRLKDNAMHYKLSEIHIGILRN